MSKDIDQLREHRDALGHQYAHHITAAAACRSQQHEIDRQIEAARPCDNCGRTFEAMPYRDKPSVRKRKHLFTSCSPGCTKRLGLRLSKESQDGPCPKKATSPKASCDT